MRRGRQHRIARDIGAGQGRGHQKGDLGLHPRLDEAARGHGGTIGEQHVIQQHAGIRRVDGQRLLHGAAGQADLPADRARPCGDLLRHHLRLHGIGLIQRDRRVGHRQQPDLPPRPFRLHQRRGGGRDLVFGHSSATPFTSAPMPSARTSTTSPGFSHTGGSCRAPAPVGVPVTMMSPGTSVVKVEI